MSSLSFTERPVHGFDLMLTPAAETTHQAPPKWTKPGRDLSRPVVLAKEVERWPA